MDNFVRAYEQNSAVGWTRIDLVLAVFDGIISKAEEGRQKLAAGDVAAAGPLLARAQIGVAALATGVSVDGRPLAADYRRLYEFVCHSLEQRDVERIQGALGVLRTLRQGFEAVRHEARELERRGAIPPLDRSAVVKVSA